MPVEVIKVKKSLSYVQEMKVKCFDLEAGKLISVLNEIDAKQFGIFPVDRVEIFNPRNKKRITTVVDVTDSMVKEDEVGLFEDAVKLLGAKDCGFVEVKVVPQPESVKFIKRKMDGERLTEAEIKKIVEDIAANKLSEIETSAFVSAVYINGFDLNETVAMTRALVENGMQVKISKQPVVDKHSIGGTNGRATMITIPILAAAGLYVPKTSSRSITSAAGTADAMEVLAPVDLPLEKIKSITENTGAVMAWGGAVDLAPADDKIIQIEHPLSLDPEGQVIASVLAKKASVGAKHLVIDIPIGPDVKVKTREKGKSMAQKFIQVAKKLGITAEVLLTDGTQPSGKNFGPALEAKEVMEILEGKIFNNLAQKACSLAGAIFELTKKAKPGKGTGMAKEILKSGQALEKMQEIIRAQGGSIDSSEKVPVSKLKKTIYSKESGEIASINVKTMTKIARTAGAPADKTAGVMLKVEPGQNVKEGDLLFEIYAENERKLKLAAKFSETNLGIELEKVVLEKID